MRSRFDCQICAHLGWLWCVQNDRSVLQNGAETDDVRSDAVHSSGSAGRNMESRVQVVMAIERGQHALHALLTWSRLREGR